MQPGNRRRSWLWLGAILAVVTGVHLLAIGAHRETHLWGDEGAYAINAKADAAAGTTSLIPGRLPFRTQPEFASRVYSKLAHRPRLPRSVAYLNACLLPLVLLLLYAQARQLGLSERAALIGTALLGVFPWFGFHVHSLWPEVLHALFFGTALLGILAALRHDRLRWLLPAGIATAFALFTKGVLNPFLPLFAIILSIAFWRRAQGEQHDNRAWHQTPIARACLAPALFLGAVLLTAMPQLIANDSAGHGHRLASNRWWNLELGLVANPQAGRTIGMINDRYKSASADPMRREELAQERTLDFVREQSVFGLLGAQASKFVRLVFERESCFERSVGDMQRWGETPPSVLASLRLPARVLWFGILGLGLVGLLLHVRTSPGWALLGAFSLAFFLAVAVIPLKVRFLLPVVPVLCIAAGATIERVLTIQRK